MSDRPERLADHDGSTWPVAEEDLESSEVALSMENEIALAAAAAAVGRAARREARLWTSHGDSVTYPSSPAWVDQAIERERQKSSH